MTMRLTVLSCLLAISQGHVIHDDRPYESFRIIGGRNAILGEFPHMVSLRWGMPLLGGFKHLCGGSIISERWILTAAHCVKAYDRYPKYGMSFISAGMHDLLSDEWNGQWSFIELRFVHEKYSDRSNVAAPYDIGLIKLRSPFKYNERVAPVSLPKKDIEPTGFSIVCGWGDMSMDVESPKMPRILQRAELQIIDRKICSKAVVNTYMKVAGRTIDENLIDKTNICTDSSTDGFSGCNGDSGGALIQKGDNGKAEVVGVVSWRVKPCGRKGSPDIYVKVSSFIDWIDNIISKN